MSDSRGVGVQWWFTSARGRGVIRKEMNLMLLSWRGKILEIHFLAENKKR